jgi:hypothetical protein
MKREKAFISYSHKDKRQFGEFKTMLAPAIRNGVVDIWDDTKIVPGAKWKEDIEAALRSARIAILLVSANFLESEFIAKNELPPLLKAAQDEGVTIFWIYLSSCLYQQTEIAAYQAAHDTGRPLDSLKRSERLAVISETCARLLRLVQTPKAGSAEHGGAEPLVSPTQELRGADKLVRRADDLSRNYTDRTVRGVAVALEEAKPLTMRTLVLNLDELFNRGTFRFEPLRECVTQEWGRRLRPAMETLELLRGYSSVVSDIAPEARWSYEKLMDAVNGYCLAMATDLFEEQVKVSEMRDYLGTEEFLTRLPKGKRWPNASEIDVATNARVDGPRIRAVREMDKLRTEFLKTPRLDGPRARAVRLMDKLRKGFWKPQSTDKPETEPGALKIWIEKLEYLRQQEALASDPAQKFTLKQQIAEAQAKIREFES